METSPDKADTTVERNTNNKLYTDLYTKKTDSHNYLRYDSAGQPHPLWTVPRTKNILYTLYGLCKTLILRGYPEKPLEKKIEKCKTQDLDNLLLKQQTNKDTNEETEPLSGTNLQTMQKQADGHNNEKMGYIRSLERH